MKAAKHFSTLIIAANQHIRLISEGSCDTEDWSNDAENSALHHRNKLHFMYVFIYLIVIVFHIITHLTVFVNKCSPVEHKILPSLNFWTIVYVTLNDTFFCTEMVAEIVLGQQQFPRRRCSLTHNCPWLTSHLHSSTHMLSLSLSVSFCRSWWEVTLRRGTGRE